MSKFKDVACLFGFHSWKITKEEVPTNYAHIGLMHQYRQRTCQHCGLVQEEDVHCLGYECGEPKLLRRYFNVKE